MHLAITNLFRARWTDMIHDEWIRNVLKDRPDLAAGQLDRTRQLMDANVLDCLVTGHESLIPSLSLPDEFVVSQMGLAPNLVCAAVKRQRASLRNPPKSVDEYLDCLTQQGLVLTSHELRKYGDLI
jgi:hypothetical protein